MDLAFGWGPAVPTEVWSSQLKTDKEKDEGGEGRKEGRREVTLLKSRDHRLGIIQVGEPWSV
jgi:hypothetical protein